MQIIAAEIRAEEHFRFAIAADLEVFGVNQFADSSVVVSVRLLTKPSRQWEAGREFRGHLKHAFEAEGIDDPFPRRTLSTEAEGGPMPVRGRAGLGSPGCANRTDRVRP